MSRLLNIIQGALALEDRTKHCSIKSFIVYDSDMGELEELALDYSPITSVSLNFPEQVRRGEWFIYGKPITHRER